MDFIRDTDMSPEEVRIVVASILGTESDKTTTYFIVGWQEDEDSSQFCCVSSDEHVACTIRAMLSAAHQMMEDVTDNIHRPYHDHA